MTEYAIIIQKYYARFRVIKKLKNLFYPLPRELQRRVLFYIIEPYLLEKYHYYPIFKIVNNRMNTLIKSNIFKYFLQNMVYPLDQEKNILNLFTENLRLFTKYFSIIEEYRDLYHINEIIRILYYRRVSTTEENYKNWTDFYDTLNKYSKKLQNTEYIQYKVNWVAEAQNVWVH